MVVERDDKLSTTAGAAHLAIGIASYKINKIPVSVVRLIYFYIQTTIVGGP